MTKGANIQLRWSKVGETALAKGFCFKMGDTKYPCVYRKIKLPGSGVHSDIMQCTIKVCL